MSAFKDFVYRKLQNHETRITNIEQSRIEVFKDIETGALYATEFGVRIPLRREGAPRVASLEIAMGRGGFSVSHTNQQEFIMFHRDRAPKCDYVMRMHDGSFKYFTKAAVPADTEVTKEGKIIKAKK